MNKQLRLNDKITVHTQAGDVPGMFVGIDGNGLARVSLDIEHAPQAIKDGHTSKHPNVWVSMADVEAR
jgi:hypothetical protein